VEKKTARDEATQFPPEFVELTELHRAFLKTVVVHFAHNGTNVPLDLKDLLPHISRAWGKRRVTIEDIRRCVAVESVARVGVGFHGSPFLISDYGRGKICLELEPSQTGSPINEKKLCRTFEKNLQLLSAERNSEREAADMDLDIPLESLSLADLPKAPISLRALAASANPLLAKGQRALAEIKNGIAMKQQEKQAKTDISIVATNADGTKLSVLDRIRLKSLAKAQAPLPPSAEELERRAALQRVGDVAAIILMLTRSSYPRAPRQAYPMAALLQKLKDSLRMPISNEEGATVIRLMAREISPEWMKIVKIGAKETVVVQTQGELSVPEITDRAANFA
jgi:hypothetical protein